MLEEEGHNDSTLAWGLMVRSTMLESISMRPSARKRCSVARRLMA
jgi:hypothetical protein